MSTVSSMTNLSPTTETNIAMPLPMAAKAWMMPSITPRSSTTAMNAPSARAGRTNTKSYSSSNHHLCHRERVQRPQRVGQFARH